MPLQEQAELWMALRDRMKENWSDLTIQEKKAGKSAPESSEGVTNLVIKSFHGNRDESWLW